MIASATSALHAWLLVGFVFAGLCLWMWAVRFTSALIEKKLAALRAADAEPVADVTGEPAIGEVG